MTRSDKHLDAPTRRGLLMKAAGRWSSGPGCLSRSVMSTWSCTLAFLQLHTQLRVVAFLVMRIRMLP